MKWQRMILKLQESEVEKLFSSYKEVEGISALQHELEAVGLQKEFHTVLGIC